MSVWLCGQWCPVVCIYVVLSMSDSVVVAMWIACESGDGGEFASADDGGEFPNDDDQWKIPPSGVVTSESSNMD